MIKLNLKAFEKDGIELEIVEGELLSEAIKRSLEGIDIGKPAEELFGANVNGYTIESDLWKTVALKPGDNVLIYPLLGDDGPAVFRTLLSVVVTVAAAYFLGPAGLGLTGVGLGVATAAVSLAGGLLINALIPPSLPNTNLAGGDYGGSQMYSITSQQNATRKFNTVPKVYGSHRIFPVVAANPYTEIETDPQTHQLVQYFYAIYDFGLGPMLVTDLKIGDTPISDFADVEYNWVDTNRPDTDEGDWDKQVIKNFLLYKGDVNGEQVSIALNSNSVNGGPEENYRVVRNAAVNDIGADKQAITLSFVNPQGLIAFRNNGSSYARTIDLTIEFSKATEDVWHGWNDTNWVESYKGVGGDSTFTDNFVEILPGPQTFAARLTTPYQELYRGNVRTYWIDEQALLWYPGVDITYGLRKGTDKAWLRASTLYEVGTRLGFNGQTIGVVKTISSYGPNPLYNEVTLEEPLTVDVPLQTVVCSANTVGLYANRWDIQDGIIDSKIFVRLGISGKARITRQEQAPCYSTFKFVPKEKGSYKVRVTRNSTYSKVFNYILNDYVNVSVDQAVDQLTLASISTRFDASPIVTDKRHRFLELKIRATNQLNGAIQNLSGVVHSVCPVWTGEWVMGMTNNPAWIYVDMLTGEVNKRAIGKERLHLPSIVEWALFCEEVPTAPPSHTYTFKRYECNFVLDYQTTLQDALNQVAHGAQASPNIIDAKYGVLIDKIKTTPVQIFTPRNSRDFSSSRVYTRKPDAVKVKYIDPGADWGVQEVVVYDDGKNETNAEEIDEITAFACTNNEQAWRYGRYLLAQNKLRQETITLTVDFEHLICTRGDYVQITQDVMKVGGTPARVKSVSGNQVVIDNPIDVGPPSYGYTYRGSDGSIHTDTLTVVNAFTFDLDGDIPSVGDLIIIGEVSTIVFDCLVKAISPNDDLTASIQLVEKADGVYLAESTDVFPPYDAKISPTANGDFTPPGEVQNLTILENTWKCAKGGGYDYYVDLDWDAPTTGAYEQFRVYVDSGFGYDEVDFTRDTSYRYYVDEDNLGKEHKFKVIAVSASGKKLDLGAVSEVTGTPISKATPPSNVLELNSDITGEVLQLSWPKVTDCDLREYFIRYSPDVNAQWERTVPLLRADRFNTTASTQARKGVYLIKAVDFNDNESEVAATAITTIPDLFNLNVIDETTDFPTLGGTFDLTESLTGALALRPDPSGNYYSEGYYYYQSLLDLGEIYTVRLQSLIQAEGFTPYDLMSNWPDLSSLTSMSTTSFSEWDVQSQYRSTNSLNLLEDWTSLDAINPIGGGSAESFTEWRTFTMGDATGRIFQFRLKLISNKPSVSPRIFDGTIRSDMPDRVESFHNLSAPSGGLSVSYTPAFKGPGTTPAIQISIDGASSGDYWQFTARTLDGFTIQFYDKNNNPVARQFDAMVKGYGRQYTAVI